MAITAEVAVVVVVIIVVKELVVSAERSLGAGAERCLECRRVLRDRWKVCHAVVER